MSNIPTFFFVSFDEESIHITISHSKGDKREWRVLWKDIVRVCYRPFSYWSSDEIYLFVKDREESHVIPTEALGGSELWGEIVRRGLFDADLAIKVLSNGELGKAVCWPDADINNEEEKANK